MNSNCKEMVDGRPCKNRVRRLPCTGKEDDYCGIHAKLRYKTFDRFPLTYGGCRINNWSDRAL